MVIAGYTFIKPVAIGEIYKTTLGVLDKQKGRKDLDVMAQILIVDDDFQVLDALQTVIEMARYEVVTAVNGKEAIKSLQQKPADLVIIDIFMPEKDGIETIREIKRDFPNVKVIAISGGTSNYNDFQVYLTLAKRLGVNYTFAKPFELEQLLNKVKELLGE